MKKILIMLLACALIFSLALTMSSCGLFNKLFPQDTPDTPDVPPVDTPGDTPGIDSEIIEGITNGGNGIELPIIDVNSQDMTQPEGGENTEGGTEEGTEQTPDAE